jgi:Holliday junction resolvasome RuvABC ATP-dependent DNA helicase subunit
MQEFLEQNEGLKSRIAFHLNFPDYSPEELTEILKLLAKKREYTLDEEALISCREIFEKATREENFGNGRYARNLLEQAILKQSSRIINDFVGKKLSKEEMCRLKKEDFQRLQQGSKKQMTRIGFTWREGA